MRESILHEEDREYSLHHAGSNFYADIRIQKNYQ